MHHVRGTRDIIGCAWLPDSPKGPSVLCQIMYQNEADFALIYCTDNEHIIYESERRMLAWPRFRQVDDVPPLHLVAEDKDRSAYKEQKGNQVFVPSRRLNSFLVAKRLVRVPPL